MDRKKLITIVKNVLKVGFTVLLIVLIFKKIDLSEVRKLLLNSNPWYIVGALLVYFCSQLMASWRLLSLLRSIGLNLPFWFNFRLYLLGMFYNVFLPGGVGGDGYKVYLLRKRYQKPTKTLILTMLLDRISGLWAIGTICVALMIMIPKIELPKAWPLAALFAGTALYYYVMQRFFREHTKYFVKTHLKAIAVQSLQLVAVICILLSQNFSDKFSPYLFSFLVSSLATILPTIGGVGIREYFMTHASGIFNMDQSLAVFTAFSFYIVSTIAAFPGIYFVYRSKEFGPMPSEQEVEAVEDDIKK